MILVDIVEDKSIPCDGGKLIYENHKYGFRLILKNVRQVKGHGVADADQLTKLNGYHQDILQLLLESDWESMEALQIRQLVKQRRESQGLRFKEANWIRPISELFRKQILVLLPESKPPRYVLDKGMARRALETKEFDK